MTRPTTGNPSADLSALLKARLPEMEKATNDQIQAIAGPSLAADPAYKKGLRLAVSAALEFGLVGVNVPAGTPGASVPSSLLAQTRNAARAGVTLDTVVRCCCVGDALLRCCLIEESQKVGVDNSILKRLLHSQQTSFDRLLESVGLEHRRALEAGLSPTERLVKGVERLLADELVDTAEIPYVFDAHHIAVIVTGGVTADEVRSLGQAIDRRVLIVTPKEGIIWAWFGGRQAPDPRKLSRLVFARRWPSDISVAVGEPSYGRAGWRLTHQQARAALAIAERSSNSVSRYADVAILSALVHDDLLVSSLNQLYVAPLEKGPDQGKSLRETLSAYFACERSGSSAAAALGVKRHTVTRRLRTVEDILGQPLIECATALDLALRLEALSPTPDLATR